MQEGNETQTQTTKRRDENLHKGRTTAEQNIKNPEKMHVDEGKLKDKRQMKNIS